MRRFNLAAIFILTMASTIAYSTTLKPFQLQWMNHADADAVFESNEHKGVLVIEAYFRSCPDCNENAPAVQRLAKHFAGENVLVLDVGRDCRNSDYTSWINRHKPNHPVLKDCDREILNQLGTRIYPTTYVLDCNLNVVSTYEDVWTTADYDKIVEDVNAQIARGCTPET